MKRDIDLIREMLLKIEQSDGTPSLMDILPEDYLEPDLWRRSEHLKLIHSAGMVTGYATLDGDWLALKITWSGYEFLDLIRDQSIWDKTQDGMKMAGGFSLDLVKALAKGFIKKNVERYTGIEVEI